METPDVYGSDSPSRISMTLPLEILSRLLSGRLLTTPAAMIVSWETDKAVVDLEYSVRFRPASPEEAVLFATDRVVQRICANGSDPNGSLIGWIREACEEFKCEESEVTKWRLLDRLWELKQFVRAYALQQDGIFDYDQTDRHRND